MNKVSYERTMRASNGRFQTRAEDGQLYIEGYFAVFGSEYKIFENAIETIDEDPEGLDEK